MTAKDHLKQQYTEIKVWSVLGHIRLGESLNIRRKKKICCFRKPDRP